MQSSALFHIALDLIALRCTAQHTKWYSVSGVTLCDLVVVLISASFPRSRLSAVRWCHLHTDSLQHQGTTRV